jgi:hypothetical protein
MATRTLQVCDFEHDPDENVVADHQRMFSSGGNTFKLDLCDDCLPKFQAFQDLTARWCNAAEEVEVEPAKTPRQRTPSPSRSTADREENAAIRAWVKTQPDIEMGERGRIPEWVRERYRATLNGNAQLVSVG